MTCSTPYCIDDYEVTGLSTLGARNAAVANAIDDSGNIAGTFQTDPPGSSLHAFRWSARDGFVDLGTLGGATSTARGVNAAGIAVGEAQLASGVIHAARFEAGAAIDLDATSNTPSSNSTAVAINADGVIVGRIGGSIGNSRAVRWSNGTRTYLTTTRSNSSVANAVNSNGDAAGGLIDDVIGYLAFEPVRFTDDMAVFLGAPANSNAGTATGINNAGALRYAGDPVALTPPDGWSRVVDQVAAAGGGTAFHMLVYVHTATADEPATYTFAAPRGVQLQLQIAAYPGQTTEGTLAMALLALH